MADDIPVEGGSTFGNLGRSIDTRLNNIFGPINRGIERLMEPPPSEYRRMNIPHFSYVGGVLRDNTNLNQGFGKPGAPTLTQRAISGVLQALGVVRPGANMMPFRYGGVPRIPNPEYIPEFSVRGWGTHPGFAGRWQQTNPANRYSSSDVVPFVNRHIPDFPMSRPPMQNQPSSLPSISDLSNRMRMMGGRLNPLGVTPADRQMRGSSYQYRGNTFEPSVEMDPSVQALDRARGPGMVLTPANRTPTQSYNLELMRQLLSNRGSGQ